MVMGIGSLNDSSALDLLRRTRKENLGAKTNESHQPDLEESQKEEEKKEIGELKLRRELTEEEKEELEALKDRLVQELASADTPPTAAQKRDIKEIEEKIQKLTGLKTKSLVGNMGTSPRADDEKDKEEQPQVQSEFLKAQQLSMVSLPEDLGSDPRGIMAQFMERTYRSIYSQNNPYPVITPGKGISLKV